MNKNQAKRNLALICIIAAIAASALLCNASTFFAEKIMIYNI
jgi:hypothetical protein